MNLKEALNYRTKCFIHNKPMTHNTIKSIKDLVIINDHSMSLFIHRPNNISVTLTTPSLAALQFNFDGTYFRDDYCPTYALGKTYHIYMTCPSCDRISDYNITNTTLDNIRSMSHIYEIRLSLKEDKTYDVSLYSESIKYHDDEKFYHVSARYSLNEYVFMIGSCGLGDSVDKVISSFWQFKTDKINMENIQNLDQVLEKMKIFNAFS